MSSPVTAGRAQIIKPTLLICDVSGRVQALTSNLRDDTLLGRDGVYKHLTEIFGRSSSITSWLTERMQEAREQEEFFAEGRLESDGMPMVVTVESLQQDGKLYGFALRFVPVLPSDISYTINDGDSIVARRQWHEIKNHIGAIKLYVTFLKRKMPDGEERRIVEKIFNSVNALIGYLDRIRRGEPQ
ncbi:MAG: hypothetical protein WAV47_27405 [Blastocatellia bacterium]